MKASEAVARLEALRDNITKPARVRRAAALYITEVMEDIIDRGGDFVLGEPFNEYVSELYPPSHVDHGAFFSQ